jgi:hypothetical protein
MIQDTTFPPPPTTPRTLRPAIAALAATVAAVTLVSAAPTFTSVWKTPDAHAVSFFGKKVAALVISSDDSLRVSGEEALARELSARGLQSVPTYRIAPKEELQSADRAKAWFERGNIEGVVAMRPVSYDQRVAYNPGTWVNTSYATFWGYYGYGWGTTYIPGSVQNETVVIVETTIYSVPRNGLLWAGVSETRDPKNLQRFIGDLVKEAVKELQKQGLAKSLPK